MLNQGDDAVRHEPRGPDRLATPSDLHDLHDTAAGRDLHAPAGARRNDLVRLHAVPDVHHDLDPVAPHALIIGGPSVTAARQVVPADREPPVRV